MERFTKGNVLKSPADESIFNNKAHPPTKSVERDGRINRGEVNEVRETPGWEKIRGQIDSGAVDAAGPREIARAFEMKETAKSKRGIVFGAAHGSGIKN
jgi:hypothetical protein